MDRELSRRLAKGPAQRAGAERPRAPRACPRLLRCGTTGQRVRPLRSSSMRRNPEGKICRTSKTAREKSQIGGARRCTDSHTMVRAFPERDAKLLAHWLRFG